MENKGADIKTALTFAAVCCVCAGILTSCARTEVPEPIDVTPDISVASGMEQIEAVTDGTNDYKYWTYHNVNGYEDFLFWDMVNNKGSGCTTGTFIYNTQIVNLQDEGYELGYPPEKLVEDIVAQNYSVYFTEGVTLNEWCNVAGEEVKYSTYKTDAYVIEDIGGRSWSFAVFDYAYETKTEPLTHYFHIIGITELADDWFTIELSGTLGSDLQEFEKYKEILSEFVELYNFKEVIPGATEIYLMGLEDYI